MTSDEYIKSFIINGTKIDLGIDDYGQCYFIEFINKNNKLETVCFGTYCTNYIEDIYYLFDPVYEKIARKELMGLPLTKKEQKALIKYKEIFKDECGD